MKSKSVISILVSLFASIIIGIALQGNIEIANKFQPLGTIYINLINMIMVQLLF